MKVWNLALRSLWRDWRGGGLRLLGMALALAVAAVTSVGFFTDRVSRALHQQGGELLAADLALESSAPLPEALSAMAQRLELRTAHTLSFPSVVLGDAGPQLVEVKAVDRAYPLRGRLGVRDAAGQEQHFTTQAPTAGQVWVEPRLLVLLDSSVGTALTLGDSQLRIGRMLTVEPDRGGNLFQLAPRVLMSLDDIPATGLVSAASRVRYRLLVAGAPAALAVFRRELRERLPANAQVLDIHNARPELRTALDQGGRFLRLAALLAVLMAGTAIALASRHYVTQQADAVALMRCLGAARGLILRIAILRLLLLALFAGLLGALLGLLGQFLLSTLVGDWFGQGLPYPSPRPLFAGLATGLVTLLGFALPPLLRLPGIPPLRVLRRDLGAAPPQTWLVATLATLALGLLLFWQADDPVLAGRVLVGTMLGLAALILAALGLVRAIAPLQRRFPGSWRFALASLSRARATTVLQIAGFGLGIMALLLLAVVRLDLMQMWEDRLPEGTPNRFLINIQPDQVAALRHFLKARGIRDTSLWPMIRGRLVQIDGHPVATNDYRTPRARRLATREFNLSWARTLQSDNRILNGRWWEPDGAQPQFSVEQGLARTLGIELGDRLVFRVAGHLVAARVTSLRAVQWDSFNVNFFVIGTPSLLRGEAATYITSFFLPPSREEVSRALIARFPNVTMLDVSALMQQVKNIVDRGAAAVELVFLFTLAAGILVLYAGIQANLETRMREAAILRTVGARRRQLLLMVTLEFGGLGLLAGTLAAGGAQLTGLLISRELFGLNYVPDPWLWLVAMTGGALGVGLAGTLATWSWVTHPPLAVLRRAE